MRAVVLRQYGGPEVLTVEQVPDPGPGPEEVVVDIVATALNRADMLQRMGLYAGPPADFEIPGLEYSGVVSAVGRGVNGLEVGDEVMGIVGGGAYAERLVVHERQTMPIPASVSLADAAAIPEVFVTSWDALVLQGGLTTGRTALVHAGASGVGTASIQIAKALGARIIVTASTGKVDRCEELGADLAIDYTTTDFAEAVADFTDGNGVDVVLDVIGGEYLKRNIASLKAQGRIIQVGVMGDAKVPINLLSLLGKRAQLIGTVLRARPIEEKIAITQRFIAEILPRFEDGSLAPVIDSRFTLDTIADAHAHMSANGNVGKIMVDITG